MRLQSADHQYINDGVNLLELSQRARELYVTQEPAEKLRFLKMLCSNYTFENGRVTPTYRQPFDILAVTAAKSEESLAREGAGIAKTQDGYPRQGSNLRPAV